MSDSNNVNDNLLGSDSSSDEDDGDRQSQDEMPPPPPPPAAAAGAGLLSTPRRGQLGAGGAGTGRGSSASSPLIPPTPGSSTRGAGDSPMVPPTPAAGSNDDMPGTPLTPLSTLDEQRDVEDEVMVNGGGGDGTGQGAAAAASAEGPNLVDEDEDNPLLGGRGETVVVRGTNIHIPTAAATFTDFLRNFRSLRHSRRQNQRQQGRTTQRRPLDRSGDDDDDLLDSSSSSESEGEDEDELPPPFYLSKLQSLVERGTIDGEAHTASLDIDTMHLYYHNQACQRLYHQLVAFPMEIVPLFDVLVKRELERLAAAAPSEIALPHLQVRPFNLRSVSNLRQLDPVAVDSLVSLVGMIVRTSPIIPDLKVAHFSCTTCGDSKSVTIDRGRISEPHRCDGCQVVGSYALVHNRCVFGDKQLVRIQERPDEVPAGQTPASVLAFCFDDLVDGVCAGDRVEITGVLRAQPARVNPKLSKLKVVYKTYVDVIHFRKITGMDSHKKQNAQGTDGIGEDVGGRDSNQKWTPERIQQLEELSRDPEIYDKLTKSLAPSIWELDNIKKGILCMLFGGNHVRVERGNAERSAMSNDDEADDNDESWLDQEDDQATTRTLNKRGDINILLVGDPGTSKSQLLGYVNKLSARGVYTSGKGSSAVGLTASVVRDFETRDLVLESGALVLSDQGICWYVLGSMC